MTGNDTLGKLALLLLPASDEGGIQWKLPWVDQSRGAVHTHADDLTADARQHR
jgi:hypothetical protein